MGRSENNSLRRRKVQGGLWNEGVVTKVSSEKRKAIFVSFHPILLAYDIVRVADGTLFYRTLQASRLSSPHFSTQRLPSGGLKIACSGRRQQPFKPLTIRHGT